MCHAEYLHCLQVAAGGQFPRIDTSSHLICDLVNNFIGEVVNILVSSRQTKLASVFRSGLLQRPRE
jgi:hypothetical protein